MDCPYCKLIPKLDSEESHRLIYEFDSSYLISGDHQTFKGYCVLVLKDHVKELTDLTIDINSMFYAELMAAVAAIKKSFIFDKINISNYGNMTPHLHWHIFPRRKSDKNWPEPVWTLMNEFDSNKTTKADALILKETLSKILS